MRLPAARSARKLLHRATAPLAAAAPSSALRFAASAASARPWGPQTGANAWRTLRSSQSLARGFSVSRKPVELPLPSFVEVDGKCRIEYVDVQPAGVAADAPTLVLIHGAPGTYRDFRHMIPLLAARGVRVLGVNLPGFGDSQVLDRDNYYQHISALPSMYLTYKAVHQVLLGSNSPVFVLGHSFGGHAAVHFTGIDANEREIDVKGLALLASAGHRPHKALVPRVNDLMWRMLRSGVAPIEGLAKVLVEKIYTQWLKFPARGFTPDYFAAGIVRCASADFKLFSEHLTRNSHLPSFVAWAKDDALIEEEVFEAVSDCLRPGPRFAFEKGGHNIQKTKAEILADELHAWISSVLDGSHEEKYENGHVHELP